jgi:hypothetical protein
MIIQCNMMPQIVLIALSRLPVTSENHNVAQFRTEKHRVKKYVKMKSSEVAKERPFWLSFKSCPL